MGNLQESWKKLRHSKWTTLSLYAICCIGFACLAAGLVLLADTKVEPRDHGMFRTLGLFAVGGGFALTYNVIWMIVRPTWSPSRETFHRVWICYWGALPAGVLLAFVLLPISWTDQAFAGLSEVSFAHYFVHIPFVMNCMLWPHFQSVSLPRPQVDTPDASSQQP